MLLEKILYRSCERLLSQENVHSFVSGQEIMPPLYAARIFSNTSLRTIIKNIAVYDSASLS